MTGFSADPDAGVSGSMTGTNGGFRPDRMEA